MRQSLVKNLYDKAVAFATKAHGDQKRKYTNEPYITHPLAVAEIVRGTANHTDEMLAAAVLHDVLEDTDTHPTEIFNQFGAVVFKYVLELTEKPIEGNRAKRKEFERNRLASVGTPAQTIKLADLIHNSASITEYDPKFAKVYMKEKKDLIEVLERGDRSLYNKAREIIGKFYS